MSKHKSEDYKITAVKYYRIISWNNIWCICFTIKCCSVC